MQFQTSNPQLWPPGSGQPCAHRREPSAATHRCGRCGHGCAEHAGPGAEASPCTVARCTCSSFRDATLPRARRGRSPILWTESTARLDLPTPGPMPGDAITFSNERFPGVRFG